MAIHYFAPVGKRREPVYFYDNPANHPVSLSGFRIQQKGKPLHSWKASIEDLDRISRVPVIGQKTNHEMLRLFSARNISWQRDLNISRTSDIHSWWRGTQTRSLNAAVIWLESEAQAAINVVNDLEVTSMTLDPTNWAFDVCPERGCNWTPSDKDAVFTNWWSDYCFRCGYCARPAFIVDGQHRIRGMARVPMASVARRENTLHEQPIFATFALSSERFNRNEMAKIFSEITGTAEGLESLHAQFLKMKYRIGTLGIHERLAYEIAAEMNDRGRWKQHVPASGAAKEGRVKMLKIKGAKGDYIDIHGKTTGLQKYVESWLDDGIVLDSGLPDPVNDNADRLETFLEAVVSVWPPGPSGNWYAARSPTGNLQEKGPFRVLLSLFDVITQRLITLGNPLNSTEYQTQLAYLSPMDWATIKGFVGQDGPRNVLERILKSLLKDVSVAQLTTTPPHKVPNRAGSASDDFNTWIVGPPDTPTITRVAFIAASRTFSFKIETDCPMVPDDAVGPMPAAVTKSDRPLNSYQDVACSVRNRASGQIANTTINISGSTFTADVEFDDPAFRPSTGDLLEFDLRFKSMSQQLTTVRVTVTAS